MIETTMQDLRYALRVLIKSPGFTIAVVLSLTLGIGANTAIFTLMDAVMWRALPVDEPERLVVVGRHEDNDVAPGFTYAEFRAMRDRATLAYLAGYAAAPLNVSAGGRAEADVQGLLVTGDYFSVVGMPAARGRIIGPADDLAVNAHPVVVLGDRYWARRFGRDPAIVGRTIRISGLPFTVIGVTPPRFFGVEIGSDPDLFVPMAMQPTVMPAFENLLDNPIVSRTWVQTIARLDGGTAPARAASELELLLRPEEQRTRGAFARGIPPTTVRIVQVADVSALRRQFSQPLIVVLGMVGVVLLIACANTANLLLSRAAARQAEFATRIALGASRARLLRQLLTESLLLALAAGTTGVLLANWTTQLLVAYISVGRTPVALDTAPSLRVLAFTAAVSALTGLLFGVAPSRRATDLQLMQALNGRRGSVAPTLRADRMLSVVQLALSLVVLAAAGLFVRSLTALSGDDRGDLRARIAMVRVEPRGSDQRNIPGTSERLDRTYRELVRRVQELPGVMSASMANGVPTAPTSTAAVQVRVPGGDPVRVPMLMVYPGYFATIGIPVIAGREFVAADLAEQARAVCIVNESFVRQFLGGRNALGEPCYTGARARLLSHAEDTAPLPREQFAIAGVVQDSRYSNPRGQTRPVIYQTFLQANTGRGQMVLHLRVDGQVGDVMASVRQELMAIDPAMPVFDVHTLDDEMQAALVQQRLIALLAGLFGGLALLLASVGLYGLFAFAVVQRRAEIGLRMAVGAQRGQVIGLVAGDALRVIALGVGIGVPCAIAAGTLMSSQIAGLLFGLGATDPMTIAGASLVLVLVSACAVVLPALHATRVDPLTVLRA